jgi:hypothetical protein
MAAASSVGFDIDQIRITHDGAASLLHPPGFIIENAPSVSRVKTKPFPPAEATQSAWIESVLQSGPLERNTLQRGVRAPHTKKIVDYCRDVIPVGYIIQTSQ